MTVTTPDGARPFPPLPGVRHRFVDIGGVRLHVAEVGQGEPVLLLHGFPQHWYAWRRVAPLLSDRYRLIIPDLRGFGWSDAPAHGYDTGTRADDVLALMDALELPSVRLIGHEWGAWVGFMLCLRAPERFRQFLALNIVHPWPLHHRLAPQSWRFWYTALLEAPLLGRYLLRHRPGFTRYLLRRGVVDQSVWGGGALEEFVSSSAEPGAARAGEALHRAFALRDVASLALGRYRKLRLSTPTHLLTGEHDFVLPPSVLPGGERNADALRTTAVPGCGHYLHEERPEVVARAALELFETPA
ncbi:pimeloyl-ACP methyl ester carboxylesterase [Kitasatospora sp. MAA4]|uniref:alpha/beta fold hydrolase n=1 Tax=Kitasatospora sp. MAA4 TaxID=3035093 RepID=UPI002474BC99|nr:alpha/beta hydrolase [Kitasatospora sp. MAA4]MDH6134188.1 pimeloyl-ACP methyl ester carboxylesterase [Kitasatospora sp. MAA4]